MSRLTPKTPSDSDGPGSATATLAT